MESLSITGVTKTVVQYLRIHIIEGELAPGQKLNEIDLSSRLGVSRPPIREAFRMLENEHLIVSTPRKGCYVSELSIEDCRKIFQVREMIEYNTIECLKAEGIRDFPEVAAALKMTGQEQAIDSYDIKIVELGSRNPFPYFHIKLVESTGNDWLIRFYKMIAPTLSRYQFMSYSPENFRKAQEEHKQILELIKEGNYGQAKKKLRTHIRDFWKLAEERIGQRFQTVTVDR
jgi:DNA-binding GntR family transcriptional regulator